MLNRRGFLAGTAGFAVRGPVAAAGCSRPELTGIETAAMRGSINATELGVQPGASTTRARPSPRCCSDGGRPRHAGLPAARHLCRLEPHAAAPCAAVRRAGRNAHRLWRRRPSDSWPRMPTHIELTGLVFDGANRWIGDHAQGLARSPPRRACSSSTIARSSAAARTASPSRRVGGRIERSTISGAADAGIYSVEAAGLAITGNTVSDCANGGILVHRWQPAETAPSSPATASSASRRAAAAPARTATASTSSAPTSVMVSGNVVSDCAFSAIRANSASNLQITGNTCSRSGETAIYAEFAFEGAVISGNIVDGAANGISIVNFNEGGRMARLLRQSSCAICRSDGPYPADAPGFGVGISVEADTAVTGNVIENAPLYGMKIGWGPYHAQRRRRPAMSSARPAPASPSRVVEGAGSAVISDNVIDGAQNGAIVGYRWADAVTGDLAVGRAMPATRISPSSATTSS